MDTSQNAPLPHCCLPYGDSPTAMSGDYPTKTPTGSLAGRVQVADLDRPENGSLSVQGNKRRTREKQEIGERAKDHKRVSHSKYKSIYSGDWEGVNKFQGHGSTLKGAILMSDYATKQECLKRNLFGLPLVKLPFIERIKAGMLLFFFEYEERKLYGVFEATSNGSRDIVPNAFTFSGHKLPAQILFKRIWMCKPLLEDEFCHAIKENYYKSHKFHFSLSYDQVFRLVQLFYIRRIDLKIQCRLGTPNEIIRGFEMRARGNRIGKVRQSGAMKCGSVEYKKKYVGNSQRYPTYQSGAMKCGSVEYKKKYVGNSQSGKWSGSTTQTGPSTSSLPECQVYGHHCYNGFPGPNPLLLPPLNLTGPCCPIYTCSSISLPLASSEGHPNLHGCAECYDHSHPRSSLSPRMTTVKDTISLLSVPLKIPDSQPEASRQTLKSIRQPSQDLLPPPDYIPFAGTDCFDKKVESLQKVLHCHSSSKCTEDSDLEKCYPALVKSQFCSDTEQVETSVFSRLSDPVEANLPKTQEACRLSKSPKSSQKNDSQKPVTSLSIDQLQRILLQRKEHGIQMAKLHKQSIIQEKAEMKPMKMTFPDVLQLNNEAFSGDQIAAGSNEHMISNYKGRSDIRKFSDKNIMSVYVDSDVGEGALEHKRRKVVKSLFSEECRYVQGSNLGIVGIDTVVENSEKNIKNGKLSFMNHSDADNQNISPSKASIGGVAFGKAGKNSEGSRSHLLDAEKENISASAKVEESSESSGGRVKEISNRNLRWFLQKYYGHDNASNEIISSDDRWGKVTSSID